MTDLKTLCLATMATEWRPLAAQATLERQPPAEYLAQLVHLEVTGRRERRIQRRLQEACPATAAPGHAPVPGGRAPLRGAASYEAEG